MKYSIWLIAAASFIAGCVSVDNYRRESSVKSEKFPNIASAVRGMPPIARLTQERGVNIKIDYRKSPVVTIDGIEDGFELVAVDGKKDQTYDFDLTSICDCFGFRKLILYPITYLVDSNGEIIDRAGVEVAGRLGPLKVSYRGTFPKDGTFFLMIVSDNSMRGKEVASGTLVVNQIVTTPSGAIPILFHFPTSLKAYPAGQVEIIWRKPKD